MHTKTGAWQTILLCPFIIGWNMQKYIIVTNNPITANNADTMHDLCHCEGEPLMDVLITVRAKIHEGHKLATHPLTSSLKPNETPYKTVLLYPQKGELCCESLELIEAAIRVHETFAQNSRPRQWSELRQDIRDDFAVIDYDMVRAAISKA